MRRVLIAQRRLQRVGLRVGREPQVLLDQSIDALKERFEPRVIFGHSRSTAYQRRKRAVVILDADGGGALAAFDDDLDLPVLLSLRLQDASERADPVNLFGRGLVNRGVV